MSCIMLFLTFCKFGLLCIGGGYMLIPLLISDFAGEGKLLTLERFGNLISVSQLTPGPVGINAATFVGLRLAGLAGALIATFGAILPGCAIVLAIALLYMRYRSLTLVQGVMDGIRPVIVATIFTGGFAIMRTALFESGVLALSALDWLSAALFAVVFFLLQKTKLSPVVLILLSGAVGCVIRMLFGL